MIIPWGVSIVKFATKVPGAISTIAAAPDARAAATAAPTVRKGARTEPSFVSRPCLLT
jgi:hypothetical protein